MPAFDMRLFSDSNSPDWFLVHTRPAYLANSSCDLKVEISPISARIPAANTGPIPGIDWSIMYALGLIPAIAFSIAPSITLISFL